MLDFTKNSNIKKDIFSAMLKPVGFYNIGLTSFERFENRKEKAADVTTEIANEKYLTIEDLHQFEAFVVNSFKEVKDEIRKSATSPMVIIGFWIGIIGFLLNIFNEYCQPLIEQKSNEQPATKQQVEDFKKFCEKQFSDTIQEVTEILRVTRKCVLRLKPKMKSLCIYNLQPGDVVNVIAINHKWAYVTTTDIKDDCQVTGWILKKYLEK